MSVKALEFLQFFALPGVEKCPRATQMRNLGNAGSGEGARVRSGVRFPKSPRSANHTDIALGSRSDQRMTRGAKTGPQDNEKQSEITDATKTLENDSAQDARYC